MDYRKDSSYDIGYQNSSTVSIGNWIVTMILMAIPVVNFVMLLVWAFGSSTPKSKSNWAKASLILMFAGIILMVLFWSSFAAFLSNSSLYE